MPMQHEDGPACQLIVLQGQELFLDARGVLVWPEESLMVVSDLHLEKGSSFAARKGMLIPPYDTQATLEKLAACIETWKPRTVVSLGDSFHDPNAGDRMMAGVRLALGQLMQQREWIWVSGNHDPAPPAGFGGTCCTSMQLGAFSFVHEPRPEFQPGEIAGHLHPCAKVRQRGKTIRRRCMVGDGRRLILPAFGAFTGGLNIRDKAYAGLLKEDTLNAWLIGSDSVYKIGSSKLVR